MLLDDINAVSTADAAVATAQQGVAAAQAQVTSAQDALTTAQAADTAADAKLSSDLQASGPVFVQNTDGTVSVYSFSSGPPGFSVTVAKPASTTAPPAPPTPPATS